MKKGSENGFKRGGKTSRGPIVNNKLVKMVLDQVE